VTELTLPSGQVPHDAGALRARVQSIR
jgi:hypothetical protein